MSMSFKYLKTGLKGLWIYSLSFIILFDLIFSRTFSDDGQTFGMFVIVSLFLQVITIFFFSMAILGFHLLSIRPNIIVNSILLLLISELSIFVLTNDISLFGIFEAHNLNATTDLDKSLIKFHKGRDFALSISGLLSCIAYTAISLVRKRQQIPPI